MKIKPPPKPKIMSPELLKAMLIDIFPKARSVYMTFWRNKKEDLHNQIEGLKEMDDFKISTLSSWEMDKVTNRLGAKEIMDFY